MVGYFINDSGRTLPQNTVFRALVYLPLHTAIQRCFCSRRGDKQVHNPLAYIFLQMHTLKKHVPLNTSILKRYTVFPPSMATRGITTSLPRVTISQSRTPYDHTSLFLVYRLSSRASGAIQRMGKGPWCYKNNNTFR